MSTQTHPATKPERRASSKNISRPAPVRRSVSREGRGSGRTATSPNTLVTVWDARLGAFRFVNPHDVQHPLHEAARALAALQADLDRVAEAARASRCRGASET